MTSPGLKSKPPGSEPQGLVGKVLSERYRIESLLGEGGMGAVYLAEHVLMRKRLAVKVLHAEMTRLPEMVARFEREAMAAAHIEHPNVAAATDFGKLENGAFFLVLEFVEGTSLRDLIEAGPIAPARALHIAFQIASGLARAHALGIVHRDLKPENVMLVERDGDPDFVKVLDFGIAKVPVGELSKRGSGEATGQVLTQLGMVYGTPEYMAPEQALGQEVDLRADLYALGVILFEMLTGVRPFEAETKVALLGMKVTSDPPSLASKNADVFIAPSVEAIVRRLLDKESSKRFQDARELLEAIEACHLGEAATDPPIRLTTTPLGRPVSPWQGGVSAREKVVSSAGRARAELDTLAAEPPLQSAARFGQKVDVAHRKLRESLAQVPPLILVAGVGFVLLLLFIVIVSIVRGTAPSAVGSDVASTTSGEPAVLVKPPPPTAPSEALAAAESTGSAALSELASRFSEDPAVWRALVRAYTVEKRGSDAMRAVAKLVSVSERSAQDQEVQDAVNAAAQGPTESADAAFALMESGLGSTGPDLLFDLSTSKGVASRTVSRVKQSLAKSDVKARMSPALAVLVEFRAASSCEAKRALLAKIKEQGDARLLSSLRSLQVAKGCGFLGLSDCWVCMRRDNALGAALAAIEERAGK